MEKRRLIACLVIKNGIVVQSIGFRKYLPVGRPEIAVEFLNTWGIDEIILLNIDATAQKRGPNFKMVEAVSKKCFVPLTVGGGISDIEQMRHLIRHGADKITINTAAIKNCGLIKQASDVLGNQCIVVSMDVRKNADGKYEVFANSGRESTGMSPVELAKRAEEYEAGEIFLNSIDRDGSKQGYDVELIRQVSEAVSIPVIACGGVGHPKHFLEGLINGKATAVAAANYFHFTEHSPITTKSFLKGKDVDVRLDSYATYDGFAFEDMGRVTKRSEEYLDKLRFEYQKEEVI
jgi:cyclase